MLNLENGIDSLTNFKRQTAEYLQRLQKTGEPVVLTVNGKAQVVVQDAAAYQKLLEAAAKVAREETVAAIREGLADVKAGRTKPAKPALRRWPRNTESVRRASSVKYRVRLTAKAEADVESVLRWFYEERATAAGERWFRWLMAKIDRLATDPQRGSVAAESEDLGLGIREFLLGKRESVYRILFCINERTVHVLRVRHGARDRLTPDDLLG